MDIPETGPKTENGAHSFGAFGARSPRPFGATDARQTAIVSLEVICGNNAVAQLGRASTIHVGRVQFGFSLQA